MSKYLTPLPNSEPERTTVEKLVDDLTDDIGSHLPWYDIGEALDQIVKSVHREHLVQLEFVPSAERIAEHAKAWPVGDGSGLWMRRMALRGAQGLPELVYLILGHDGTRAMMSCRIGWCDVGRDSELCLWTPLKPDGEHVAATTIAPS